MRHVRKICAASLLTLAITFSAPAGEMQFPGVTPPPPAPQVSATGDTPEGTTLGDIQAPGVTDVDPVTGTLLALLRSTLFLF